MNLSWELVQTFHAVAEHSSFSAAARALSVTQPTVSRRISALEEKLSQKLFERDVEGATLTNAGLRLLPAAVEMARNADELRQLSEDAEVPRGVVRIAASDPLALELLGSLSQELARNYPELCLQIVAEESDDCDLRLSQGRAPRPQEKTWLQLSAKWGVFAAFEPPCDVTKLNELRWICAPSGASPSEPQHTLRSLDPLFQPAFSSADPLLQTQALRSGLGVMRLAKIARSEATYGPLHELDVPHPWSPNHLTLSVKSGTQFIARVQATQEVLLAQLQGTAGITLSE